MKVVVITPDELRALVREAVREELRAMAGPPTRADDLLTTPMAAEYTGLSKRVLLAHVQAGRLVPDAPARKGFRVHRFKRSTLDALLAGTGVPDCPGGVGRRRVA